MIIKGRRHPFPEKLCLSNNDGDFVKTGRFSREIVYGGGFLFPPIAVWLMYWLSRRLSVPRSLSLLAAVTAVTATKLIELVPYPRPVWDYLIGLKGSDDFLFFSRNFHPQLSFLLFAGMILTVIETMEMGGRKKNYYSRWISRSAVLYIFFSVGRQQRGCWRFCWFGK